MKNNGENKKEFTIRPGEILTTKTNYFNLLYKDAETFLKIAESHKGKSFEQVRYSRNTILLFILSMGAFINRVLYTFGKGDFPKFFKDEVEKWSLQSKWFLAPFLCGEHQQESFPVDSEPWQSFRGLIKFRNNYTHPKPTSEHEYVYKGQHIIAPVDKTKKYQPTGIPEDPYNLMPEHARVTKKIVDAMIEKLDELLDGRVKKNSWLHTDEFEKKT